MCAISAHIECYCAINELNSGKIAPCSARPKSAIIAPNGAKISSFELKYANLPFWVKWVFLLDLPLKSLFWAQNELKWDKYRLFGHILACFLENIVNELWKLAFSYFERLFLNCAYNSLGLWKMLLILLAWKACCYFYELINIWC